MKIEWPHNIDCPACLGSGECSCWVKEARTHVKQLEAENATLREYATHKPGCHEGGSECICELDALLTGADDA